MTEQQIKYCKYLQEIEAIANSVCVESDRVILLKKEIESAELLIPVIGAFSSGKSTLLNSFLGELILPVDITPETALATELHFSTEERLDAVKADGHVDHYVISDFEKLQDRAEEYRFVRAYLNKEMLRDIEPLVLVDMPGFDSPLDLHNQAILEYISRGAHYMVLTSVHEGNLTRSMLRQISEVYDARKGISFFLSQSNLRAPDEVVQIAKKVAEQLEDQFDTAHQVIPVGIDGGDDLEAIVQGINPNHLIEKLYDSLVLDAYQSLKGELNTRIATLRKGREENTETVKELQKGLELLVRKKENLLQDVEGKYTNMRVDRIVDRVGKELSDSIDELTQVGMASGSEALRQRIGEIVRCKLLQEMRISMSEISNQIIDDITFELKAVDSVLSGYAEGDLSWIERAVEQSKLLLERGVGKLEQLSGSYENKARKDVANKTYKFVATILGLTTSVVAPVVEIIIIFLPEIIAFFSQKIREQKQKEEIRNAVMTQVIPEIKSKLRSEIPMIFNAYVGQMVEEIGAQFEVQIEKQKNIISAEQAEVESKQLGVDTKLASYSEAVDKLVSCTSDLISA